MYQPISDHFLENSDTVVEIGKRLGFELYGFNPSWTVCSEKYECAIIPDELMGNIAKYMELPWINLKTKEVKI